MRAYKEEGKKLTELKTKRGRLEKYIQRITEENLDLIFGLDLIKHEYSIKNQRFDTLAFDKENKAFVIIEFKKDRNISIIDQGFAYLSTLLNNKAEVVLEYNEQKREATGKKDFDWSQSRVFFVAPSFTEFQKRAIGFEDLPINLWEVTLLEGNIIVFDEVTVTGAKGSLKSLGIKQKKISEVSREVKVYTVEDLIKKNWERTRELYELFKDGVMAIDERIEEKPRAYWISYKIGNSNLCCLHPQKSKLLVELVRVEKKDLRDPEGKVVDIPWQDRGWGKMCHIYIEDEAGLDYALGLIKQIYRMFFLG